MVYLYNSLTRRKEEFQPLDPPHVGMYTCGPTVHDYVHIGNLRAYVFNDMLKRVLLFGGFKVVHVMNVTDVDDKIIKKANEVAVTIAEFTQKYTEAFFEDIKKVNVVPADFYPKATEYVPQMVKLIRTLLDKGYAYKAEDGSVYFSIGKFAKYGALSQLERRQIKPGVRVSADEYTKENVQDFALWKAEKFGEPSWDAPFGKGRPGWHIECSAMSMDILGETLDIHAGGVDLLFPHHEDEIAQSEAATGKQFSRYWVHNEHLLVDGKKMSKSLGNFYTLRDVEAKGFDALVLRYLFLTAHYRDQLNFTWESLGAAQSAYERLRSIVYGVRQEGEGAVLSVEKQQKYDEFRNRFVEALNGDLGTPQALAVVWEVVKSSLPSQDKLDLLLLFDGVLGLDLGKVSHVLQVPKEVQELMDRRESLRKEGRFEEADGVRQEIGKMGYTVEDALGGSKLVRMRKK